MATEPLSERLIGVAVRSVLSALLITFWILLLGVNIDSPEMKFVILLGFTLVSRE